MLINRISDWNDSKPPTEKLLVQLQDRWLSDRDNPLALDEFFSTMATYARSLTLKINRGKVYLTPSRVLEISTDAVLKVFDKYQKNPEFKVNDSFAGWVKYPIIELLYGPKQRNLDQIYSLNSIVNYDSESELIDIQEKLKFSSISGMDYEKDPIKDYEEVLKVIMSVFKEAKNELTYRQQILFKMGFILWLRRPKSRFVIPKFMSTFFSLEEEQTFEIFMLELRNRMTYNE
jgi:hypothetical protein